MQTFAKKQIKLLVKIILMLKKRPVEYPDSFLNTSFTKNVLTL